MNADAFRAVFRPTRFTARAGLATLLLITVAVPTGAVSRAAAPAVAKPDLVWPLPPETPRIRYLESLTGDSTFRKQSRLKRLLLGPVTDPGITLLKPYGVATDHAGRVYVSDTGLGAVVVFDRSARQVRLLGNGGRAHLATPMGIAIDELGRLFVADAGLNQVLCLDGGGEVLLALGREQGMENPAGIAIDRNRHRLYVADSHLHQILVYGTDGVFQSRWGSRGPGLGEFNFPTNLALDEAGTLYIVDTGNFRVQILSPDGSPLSAFGRAGDGPGQFHRPKGIALDSAGHVYVADAAFNNFQIFDREGRLLLDVGSTGRDPGTFWLPAGMHIDGKNELFVVDQINRRVQIFRYIVPR